MKITFINTSNTDLQEYFPEPASKSIPEWYKSLESYIGGQKKVGENNQRPFTIKRCMPVFDAINAGYIIKSITDVQVEQVEHEDGKKYPYFKWASMNAIEFHAIEQAPTHPNASGGPFPKWINPWGIKTPKGYSCLFVPPMHRESVFSILPGVVDTDKYLAPVNFPFMLKDSNFEGIIPAGTPIAQIIPIKRNWWRATTGSKKDIALINKIFIKLQSKFFDGYKDNYRAQKKNI